MKIEELDLSVRAYNCLVRAGIDTVEKLRDLSVDDLARTRNMSTRAIEEIQQKLAEHPMSCAQCIQAMSEEELAKCIFQFMHSLNKAVSVDEVLERIRRPADQLSSIM